MIRFPIIKISCLMFLLFCCFSSPVVAQVQYEPLVVLPYTTETVGGKEMVSPKSYITGGMRLVIGIAGILAVIMIIIGGFQYVTSDGFGKTSDAKDRIRNALLGLLLAIGSYSILYTLSPEGKFVNFNLDIKRIAPPTGSGLGTDPNDTSVGVASGRVPTGCKAFRTAAESRVEMETVVVKVWGVDGDTRTRYVTVQKCITDVTKTAFDELYRNSKFPISAVEGQNWRVIASGQGAGELSAHSQGLAFDINASANGHYNSSGQLIGGGPYLPCGSTVTRDCSAFSFPSGGSVVTTFKRHGFGWGGDWRSSKDYMHFSCYTNEGGRCPVNRSVGSGAGGGGGGGGR